MGSDYYAEARREHAEKPVTLKDFTAVWAELKPISESVGETRRMCEEWAEQKGVTLDALAALGTRVRLRGYTRLAWAYPAEDRDGRAIVSAIKYRDIDGPGERTNEPGSYFAQALLVGNAAARRVIVAEGETDAARLYDLVGSDVQVMCIGAGAQTFRPEWLAGIAADTVVFMGHDADQAGDDGAERAMAMCNGHPATRLRPPGVKDWCLWPGGRAELLELLQAAPAPQTQSDRLWPIETWTDFWSGNEGDVEYLISDVVPAGGVAFLAAEPKGGKTWLALVMAVCVATGKPWAGHAVPKAAPVIYVALEGTKRALRARIGCIARGVGVNPATELDGRLVPAYRPRGLDLGDEAWAVALAAHVERVGAGLVVIDTLRSAASVRESNEGARDFAKLLGLLGDILTSGVTILFLHHFTKLSESRQLRAPADRMTGTGALRGHMDCGLFITKYSREEYRYRLEHEMRDGVSLDPFGVRLTGEGTGTNGAFTSHDAVELVVDTELLGEQQAKAPAGEIAAWIREQPHARATSKEIRDHFDIGDATLRRRRDQICSWGIEYIDAGRFSQYRVVDQAGE